jgi:hypothetical protein
MAEPILDASRVVASIRHGVPAGVPQHVRVHRKGEASARADALDQAIESIGRERAGALGGGDEGRVRALPAQLTQRSHHVAAAASSSAQQLPTLPCSLEGSQTHTRYVRR